jgi:hypothetical protein
MAMSRPMTMVAMWMKKSRLVLASDLTCDRAQAAQVKMTYEGT